MFFSIVHPSIQAQSGCLPWNIAIIGDTQSIDPGVFDVMLPMVKSYSPDLLLHVGDLHWGTYTTQPLSGILDIQYHKINQRLRDQKPVEIHVAPGNHDDGGGGSLQPNYVSGICNGTHIETYIDNGKDEDGHQIPPTLTYKSGFLPFNPDVANVPNYCNQNNSSRHYSFVRGNIRFITMDMNDSYDTLRQLVCEPTNTPATIVMKHGNDFQGQRSFVDSLTCPNNLKAIISGHGHDLNPEQGWYKGVYLLETSGMWWVRNIESDKQEYTNDFIIAQVSADKITFTRTVWDMHRMVFRPPEEVFSIPGSFSCYNYGGVAPTASPTATGTPPATVAPTTAPACVNTRIFINGSSTAATAAEMNDVKVGDTIRMVVMGNSPSLVGGRFILKVNGSDISSGGFQVTANLTPIRSDGAREFYYDYRIASAGNYSVEGYVTSTPPTAVPGTPNWASATAWSRSLDTATLRAELPGSPATGEVQALDVLVYGGNQNKFMQFLWLGNVSYIREVLFNADGTPNWASATAWSRISDITGLRSELPGGPVTGDIRALDAIVYQGNQNKLMQVVWVGDRDYVNSVPFNADGTPNWTGRTAWSSTTSIAELRAQLPGVPASGDVRGLETITYGGTAHKFMQIIWVGDSSYTREVPFWP